MLSALLWAAYSVAIGLFFGQWFEENHLLGVIVAVVCAVGLGILVDLVISRLRGTLPGGRRTAGPSGGGP